MVQTRRFRGGKRSRSRVHRRRSRHHSTHRRKVKRHSRRGTKNRRRRRTKRMRGGWYLTDKDREQMDMEDWREKERREQTQNRERAHHEAGARLDEETAKLLKGIEESKRDLAEFKTRNRLGYFSRLPY